MEATTGLNKGQALSLGAFLAAPIALGVALVKFSPPARMMAGIGLTFAAAEIGSLIGFVLSTKNTPDR